MTYENPAPAIDPLTLRRARDAVFLAFAITGLGFASWASRLPDIRTALDLTPGQLGTLLLTAAAGSVISLPAAGSIIARVGTRRTVELAATAFGLGLGFAAISVSFFANPYLTGIGMFVMGLGMGS